MKKLFFILTSIFIFLVIFPSCQKEEYNEWHEEKQIISKNAIITNNPDLLNARIFLKNQPIPVVPFTGEKENQDINIQDHKGNYRFVLKADVAPCFSKYRNDAYPVEDQRELCVYFLQKKRR